MTALEETFALQLRAHKLENFIREHKFHPERRWRFDFADIDRKIAVELQGGIFGGKSGHNTGVGIRAGMEKMNEAQRAGWRVYQFYVDQVKNGTAINYMIGILTEDDIRIRET